MVISDGSHAKDLAIKEFDSFFWPENAGLRHPVILVDRKLPGSGFDGFGEKGLHRVVFPTWRDPGIVFGLRAWCMRVALQMKAVTISKYGDQSVLTYADSNVPNQNQTRFSCIIGRLPSIGSTSCVIVRRRWLIDAEDARARRFSICEVDALARSS